MSEQESPTWNHEMFPAGRKIIKPDGTERIIRIHKELIPNPAENEASQADASISTLTERDVSSLFEKAEIKTPETVVYEAPHPNGKAHAPVTTEAWGISTR